MGLMEALMHDAITSELVELRGQRRGREMPVGGIFQKKSMMCTNVVVLKQSNRKCGQKI